MKSRSQQCDFKGRSQINQGVMLCICIFIQNDGRVPLKYQCDFKGRSHNNQDVMQGQIQGGEDPGGQELYPPPPSSHTHFFGTPNLIKRGKNVARVRTNATRSSS